MNNNESIKRVKIEINGIVQGVGFRPFIYQLALQHSLKGYILNNGYGVVIEIQGNNSNIDVFMSTLESTSPTLSRIDSIKTTDVATKDTHTFSIIESKTTNATTMISPDISICDDCKNEMNDPKNRRYKYPFINCTNCGPRYTIVNSLPYDRKNTSMKNFKMCEECSEEYNNPLDRRFHAQPISCYKCGPKLLYSQLMSSELKQDKGLVDALVERVNDGKTVALKGIGGFHLICDATNENAVRELRLNKHRPTKPFAVMFKNINDIKKECLLSKKDEELIESKERPIVIVNKKDTSSLALSIAPNIDRLGVFLPYTPLHELLLNKLEKPIVATSANLSDEPIITDEKKLFKTLPLVVQDALSNDREILNACDDSVVLNIGEQTIVLRLSRGFAPKSFYTKNTTTKKILALGAHQKNTITLAFDGNIILSPHIGDLNSIEAFEYFLRTLSTFKRFYNFEPDIIVCDKHPEYETTKWAKEYVSKHPNVELVKVQHHYAHALACMSEYDLDEEALAFCFDGTGYGDDGSLWGGEVLTVTPREYKRAYHLQEFSLLGGSKAIREPRRIALSLLFECFTQDEILDMNNELVNSFSKEEYHNYYLMYENNLNSPRSTSIGRLFDAVYALIGNFENIAYEGESGLILEKYAHNFPSDLSYSYSINNETIEIKEVLLEILNEKEKNIIAAKFVNTLVKIMIAIAKKHSHLPVLLSGGVFQNKILLEKVIHAFKADGIRHYIQSQTPINDGGISYGQAYHVLMTSSHM